MDHTQSLPDEILVAILSLVHPAALWVCPQVCRRWCTLMKTPALTKRKKITLMKNMQGYARFQGIENICDPWAPPCEREPNRGVIQALVTANNFIFTGHKDGNIHQWSLSGRHLNEIRSGHSRSCLALSPDGMHLFFFVRRGIVWCWSVLENKRVRSFISAGKRANRRVASCLKATDDMIIAAWMGGNINCWETESGHIIKVFSSSQTVVEMTTSPNHRLYCRDESNSIEVWTIVGDPLPPGTSQLPKCRTLCVCGEFIYTHIDKGNNYAMFHESGEDDLVDAVVVYSVHNHREIKRFMYSSMYECVARCSVCMLVMENGTMAIRCAGQPDFVIVWPDINNMQDTVVCWAAAYLPHESNGRLTASSSGILVSNDGEDFTVWKPDLHRLF
eukprot:m.347000 g.347000  ORF g.347000 m.347000 type:complete len:389 (+) comp30965_c0_seq1:118-1284(+)